ncbi:hypothetical protein MUP59_02550 [Candidatus Bathyarchaeota archaeon]|nr:hypothetical protein [Candidatus Bathyarchaeota archaeon]
MFKTFKLLTDEQQAVFIVMMLMMKENVCGECGKHFMPLQEGQRICTQCTQIEDYMMLRSNRWCKNCLS